KTELAQSAKVGVTPCGWKSGNTPMPCGGSPNIGNRCSSMRVKSEAPPGCAAWWIHASTTNAATLRQSQARTFEEDSRLRGVIPSSLAWGLSWGRSTESHSCSCVGPDLSIDPPIEPDERKEGTGK